MGPTWVLLAADWPHVGAMNLAIRGSTNWNNDTGFDFPWFSMSQVKCKQPVTMYICMHFSTTACLLKPTVPGAWGDDSHMTRRAFVWCRNNVLLFNKWVMRAWGALAYWAFCLFFAWNILVIYNPIPYYLWHYHQKLTWNVILLKSHMKWFDDNFIPGYWVV